MNKSVWLSKSRRDRVQHGYSIHATRTYCLMNATIHVINCLLPNTSDLIVSGRDVVYCPPFLLFPYARCWQQLMERLKGSTIIASWPAIVRWYIILSIYPNLLIWQLNMNTFLYSNVIYRWKLKPSVYRTVCS